MVAARVRNFNWIWKYLLAIGLGFVAAVRFFGHYHPTPMICLLGVVSGVVAMGVLDICIWGRYMLANRALAKQRRRREAQRKPRGDHDELEP